MAIFELDLAGTVLEWNPAIAKLLGWPADQVVGGPLPADILGKHVGPERLTQLLTRLAGAASNPTVQLRCRHRAGRLVQTEISLAPLWDRRGRVRGVMGVIIDGTERRRLERRLRYQAQHDSLTSLPNRDMLLACCEEALDAAARTGTKTGLLMIDLDKFKEVNDTLGHAYGDQLLAQIGPRLLSGTVRTNDLVARLAGDEFAVLLPDLDDTSTAVVVAERVLAALHSPFMLDSTTADVAASIGIAVAPEHGEDPNELLQHADIAMYEAKEATAGIKIYEPDRRGRQPTRFGLLGELRRALDRGELVVHYQPKVDIGTGALCGAEALVRWQHPDRGLLPPAEFVPVAENTGLMRRLTDYVLDVAIAQVRTWADDGLPIPVSVNLSARGLHDHDLPGRVLATLRSYGVPTSLLCLEITETAIMHDPDSALAVLGELSRAGIGLSLDDFGTGYSSMSYLQRLPITELKVDRSFVAGIVSEHADNVLVRTAVDLGHDLHLPVVAEGVEDADTLARLQQLGCDVAQGYYLARPMPVGQFNTWLAANQGTRRQGSDREEQLPA